MQMCVGRGQRLSSQCFPPFYALLLCLSLCCHTCGLCQLFLPPPSGSFTALALVLQTGFSSAGLSGKGNYLLSHLNGPLKYTRQSTKITSLWRNLGFLFTIKPWTGLQCAETHRTSCICMIHPSLLCILYHVLTQGHPQLGPTLDTPSRIS